MDIEKLIQEITDIMDQAIADFNKGVSSSQEELYAKLETILKNELEVKGSTIKPSARNYRLIGQLRQQIVSAVLNNEYMGNLQAFINTHDIIAGLIENYFSVMEPDFNPKANELIKQSLIETTVNSLTEAGIGINIADPIRDILSTNITTGGSYSDLTKQLRDTLLNNQTGDGSLLRYTKQISVDAINQYSAQYMHALASDLGLEWYQYVGSNIRTSRPFCIAMTDKRYFHVSELPSILSGDIDGNQISLNADGLPQVMIGGYNCRHQCYPISAMLVPKYLVDKFKS